MAKKNLLFGILALLLLLLAGAVAVAVISRNQQEPDRKEIEHSSDSGTESITSATSIAVTDAEPTESAPTYPTITLAIPEIHQQESLMIVEAELTEYSGSLHVETERSGYSGSGYLSAFQEGDNVRALFMIPASQHYDITISVCADVPVINALLVNDEKIGEFTVTEQEHFVRVTFPAVYLPAGQTEVSLQAIDGNVSLDYVEISNHTELSELDYQHQDDLSDANASPNARKLMQYLREHYGKQIISGQYTASELNTELDFLYYLTGKYPAVRFSDMQGYSSNSHVSNGNVIAACEAWAERGGIVGLLWHWDAPSGTSTVYAEDTSFSLADAMPSGMIAENGTTIDYQIDVALLTDAEISAKLEDNSISESCALLLKDIDCIAEAMKPLAEKDIPVLWRPLHEAGGGWFWWGADGSQAYRWLWDVLYRRMTEYHQLHNLIWIWNGQNENYFVDNYDIASLDIYLSPEEDFNSRHEQFLILYHMTKGRKLLALSECSTVPDVNLMFRDNTVWSFCGLWYDEYLTSETYTSKQDMIAFYNSEAVITLQDIQGMFH